MVEYAYGRIAATDSRDSQYGVDLVLPTEWPKARKRHWTKGPILNQGQLPIGFRNSCVGHGCRQLLTSTPKPRRDGLSGAQIYDLARKQDQWAENDYIDAGTSVRAGFQVMRDMGYIGTYLWAFNVDMIAKWILRKGPVVIGTQWMVGMLEPNVENVIVARGQVVGLHCTSLLGANRDTQKFLLANSWGENEWGIGGLALISFDDMELLLEDQGEAVVAIESRLVRT